MVAAALWCASTDAAASRLETLRFEDPNPDPSPVVGYRLYVGPSTDPATSTDIGMPAVAANGFRSYSLAVPDGATVQVTLTALDAAGRESPHSNAILRAPRRAAFDFDGDGGSDLLRIDSTDGRVEVLRNGREDAPEVLSLAAPPASSIVARGDFDGSGTTDLLWQRNGELGLTAWLVSAAGGVETADLPTPGPLLRLLGVGDLDGDGRADLAFEEFGSQDLHLWFMNGGALREESVIPGPPDTWLLVGIADVDADRRSDFVWQEPSSGAIHIWHMNGSSVLEESLLPGAVPVGAEPIGLGDYDEDGAADLFVRLGFGGWIAALPVRDGVGSLSVVARASGQVAAAVGHDFDGDGVTDLVLVDLSTRSVRPLLLGPNAPGTIPIDFSGAALPGDLARELGDNDGDWYPDSCDADFNNDGAVGMTDLLLYEQCVGGPAVGICAPVDLDGDGVIGFNEFLLIGSEFGQPVCSGVGTP